MTEERRKRRLLVVEPDLEFRRMLRDFLVAQRFDVALAATADEALQQVDELAPDLIILCRDLPRKDGSPGLEGLRVLNVLKIERQMTSLPIILTSAIATESDFDRYRRCKFSADDYLRKPFEDTELLRRIENLIGFDLSDGEDLNQIRRRLQTVTGQGQGNFFHPDTDSLGAPLSPAARQEITNLLQQVNAELERQEKMLEGSSSPEPPLIEGRATSPEGEEISAEVEKIAELEERLQAVERELREERKRSRELKIQWKKKLAEIAGRLRESEEREALLREEFEKMRRRFADLELDHTMELEKEKGLYRRLEEELRAHKEAEEKYPRHQLEEDLRQLTQALQAILERLTESKT